MIERIKENPIKYVRLFSIVYLIMSITTTLLYYIIIGQVAFNFGSVIAVLISKIPFVLFLIYSWKFYGTKKTQALLPVSYTLSIIMSFFAIIKNIRNLGYISYYNSFKMAVRYGMLDNILNVIFGLVGLSIAIFLLVDCLSKFKRLKASKKLVIVNAAISMTSIIIGTIIDLSFGLTFTILSVVGILMSLSSVFSLSAYIIFWNFAIDRLKASPIEFDLIQLKKMYENGIISEDVYTQKRTELLEKF